MPTYEYLCDQCEHFEEIFHSMSDETKRVCPDCGETLRKLISGGYFASKGFKPTKEDYKESEHRKKVKDFERAVRARKRMFGKDSVGDPNDKPDPMHIVRRGRTLGGQNIDIDKRQMAKALAPDPLAVKLAQDALKKRKSGQK